MTDPDEFVPFELAMNGKFGPIGGNGNNSEAPPQPPPPPSAIVSNNNGQTGGKNGKSIRRPCTLSIANPAAAAAAAQAQFYSSTTTTITTPLGTLRGTRNSPVTASWFFNSPQGFPAAAHIVASPVTAIGPSYITIHSPANIIEQPNFFGSQNPNASKRSVLINNSIIGFFYSIKYLLQCFNYTLVFQYCIVYHLYFIVIIY